MAEGTSPKTLVFFDTETTGLPNRNNPPKITELSFQAVLLDLEKLELKTRAINKLILLFNPEKEITTKAAELSRLTNAIVQDSPTFSEQAPMLTHFLRHLPRPVCLVAHNGDRFDFPLLVEHLVEAGVDLADLDYVTCADTLKALKALKEMDSYKLVDVYQQLCGREPPPDAHSAEVDAQMLMEIVGGEDGMDLLNWIINNSSSLSSFDKS